MIKNLVANLYNPHEQTKEELIKNFVVRHKIFNRLFRAIKCAEMRYPEQHFLIEGQRGMGKTTLLLRLSYEIENDNDLNTWLVPVVLKEEAYYGITRLFKLWETVAEMLADRDTAFAGLSAQMEKAYDENSDYERICFGLLVNALEKQGKKIILFIDNVGEMFKNFGDMESHRLREILMNCAQLRIVGATAVTLEASFRYEHAFYEFFRKETLGGLDKAETHNLLLQLAEINQTTNAIQNIIENQPGRVETLRILTGGVIRTVVLLFDIFVDNQNGNAISDLDGVLDRVTPLYKHRMDDLAPLQRDVVHTIALNWDAINPDEIAHKARLKKEAVSALIGELEKVFIIQRAATDTQTHLYSLSERFFNIWYLMRLAPKGSQTKVIWLVRFLESWYGKDELVQRAKKQIDVLSKGDYYPKGALVFTEALAGTAKLDMETEHELKSATRKFLAEKDKGLLAELSPSDKDLYEEGMRYYWNKKYEKAVKLFLQIKNQNEDVHFRLRYSFDELKQYEKAEKYYLMAVEKENVGAMFSLGILYQYELKDYQKAEKYFLMAVEKEYVYAMYNLGYLYAYKLKDYAQAEKYYLMAVEKGNVFAMNSLAWFYFEQKIKKEEALKYAIQAVEKDKSAFVAHTLACVYLWHNQIKQAIQIAKGFMYAAEAYEKFEDAVLLYLMLLIAKQQYQHTATYFEAPDLNLKDRFKPLYYALLYFTGDKDYAKRPPELAEPVNDIIEKIKQMAVDYA